MNNLEKFYIEETKLEAVVRLSKRIQLLDTIEKRISSDVGYEVNYSAS